MKSYLLCGLLLLGTAVCLVMAQDRPDPREIPVPPIATSMKPMPGVNDLPNRPGMPDVLTMNDGRKVTTPEQWKRRREEMKQILEYYAVGQAPPPPGNVKGHEISSQTVLSGKAKYRLVHLTFGPKESLSLDIGIFTPAEGGPFPALISPSGSPPGATALPRLPQGPNQGRGEDVLLLVGPGPERSAEAPKAPGPGRAFPARTAESIAAGNPALAHGFAFVTFNNNDCGEDTTLRNSDGSWAYRNTRFYPAYPKYDWGLLRGWAWGVSRIVDYLETDPAIDKTKLIVTGVSRTGKSALIAGAFDDRLAMVAPVASSGGGTPAYRFSGAGRGGKEGLTEMVRKYPNWFSPHLHEFWGQPDKLPFDEHWFMALAAPRPFIALEGTRDQNVNQNGVRQSWLAAQPAFALFHATDRLGVNWADRPHGMVQDDWDALLAFADKFLLGKPLSRTFDRFPAAEALAPARIILVGDSTVAPRNGWGPGFCADVVPQVTCINLAKNGRSSATYRAEGSWAAVMDLMKTNAQFSATYVMIQFGHNDQPGKPGRSTDLATEFPANLRRYVEEVKAAGARPVLITSLTRRIFQDGKVKDDLEPWAEATRKVAAAEGVPVLDLHTESLAAVQKMGPVEANTLAQAPPPPNIAETAASGNSLPAPKAPPANVTEPNGTPPAVFDYTHLGEKGSALFGRMVAGELVRAVPDLRAYVKQ